MNKEEAIGLINYVETEKSRFWDVLYSTKGVLTVIEWGELAHSLDVLTKSILDELRNKFDIEND